MNSSATLSNSTSGLSEALRDGDGLGEGEEAGAGDFVSGGAESTGFFEGVGEGFGNGFTVPVGFEGEEGAGFASGFGVGEGDGAACTLIQQNKPAQETMAGPCRRKFFMNTAHPNEEVVSIKRQRRRPPLRVANFRTVNDDGRWPGNIIL
jgi:hypothetical protein